MLTLNTANASLPRQLWLFAHDEEMNAPPVKRKRLNHRAPKFDERLLQLPLFGLAGDPETVVVDIVDLQTIGYIPEAEEETEPPLEWSSSGIEQLHSVLLHQSLAALAGRGNGLQKREILEWIFEPDLFGEVIRNGVSTPIFNWDVPWSFLFCCRLERMHNPEIIRDFIRGLLPQGSAMFLT